MQTQEMNMAAVKPQVIISGVLQLMDAKFPWLYKYVSVVAMQDNRKCPCMRL
jgi:hypothetical protein